VALINIVLGNILEGATQGLAIVPTSRPSSAEGLSSSEVSKTSIQTAPTNKGQQFWSVTATGGDVWLKFAAAPVAAAGSDWLLLAGQTREWAAIPGDKVGVVDA
jgi:hypothetical protein